MIFLYRSAPFAVILISVNGITTYQLISVKTCEFYLTPLFPLHSVSAPIAKHVFLKSFMNKATMNIYV